MKLLKLYEGVLNESTNQFCVSEIQRILDNGNTIRPNYIETIRDLKKCIASHPEMLQVESVAYRGVNMPISDVLSHYIDITDDKKNGGKFSFIYKPKTQVQGWSDDINDVEKSVEISPMLNMIINNYKNGNGNPKEVIKNLDNITIPVIISLNSSPDDLLIKGSHLKYLSDDKDDLFRINTQPTQVNAKILDSIFDSVYEILTSVRRLHK